MPHDIGIYAHRGHHDRAPHCHVLKGLKAALTTTKLVVRQRHDTDMRSRQSQCLAFRAPRHELELKSFEWMTWWVGADNSQHGLLHLRETFKRTPRDFQMLQCGVRPRPHNPKGAIRRNRRL